MRRSGEAVVNIIAADGVVGIADGDNVDTIAWGKGEDALNALVPNRIWCKKWLANHEDYGLDFSLFDVSEETCSGTCMFVPQPMYESLSPNPNETIKQMKWAKAVGLAE